MNLLHRISTHSTQHKNVIPVCDLFQSDSDCFVIFAWILIYYIIIMCCTIYARSARNSHWNPTFDVNQNRPKFSTCPSLSLSNCFFFSLIRFFTYWLNWFVTISPDVVQIKNSIEINKYQSNKSVCIVYSNGALAALCYQIWFKRQRLEFLFVFWVLELTHTLLMLAKNNIRKE